MPRKPKLAKRFENPFTFRIYQVTEAYMRQMEALIDSMHYIMLANAKNEMDERLKNVTGGVFSKINTSAKRSGRRIFLQYNMPESFHQMNKGLKPGVLSEKSQQDVNKIKKWLKVKRKQFGANFSQFQNKELETRRRFSSSLGVRKAIRHYTIRDGKTKRMTQEEVAKIITRKISAFGTRSSRFKFIGIQKYRKQDDRGDWKELNKPRYLTYSTLISTAIMQASNKSLKEQIENLKTYKPLTFDFSKYKMLPKNERFRRTFRYLTEDDRKSLEDAIFKLEKELSDIYIYFRYEKEGRWKRKVPRNRKNEYGEWTMDYVTNLGKRRAPRVTSKSGKVRVETKQETRNRAIQSMITGKGLKGTKFKTAYDILESVGLLTAIPPDANKQKADVELKRMLKRVTMGQLSGVQTTVSKTNAEKKYRAPEIVDDDVSLLEKFGNTADLQESLAIIREAKEASKKAKQAAKKQKIRETVKQERILMNWADYIQRILRIIKKINK